jgi:hypothetical protein
MHRKKNMSLLAIILTVLIFSLVGSAFARKVGGKAGLIYERLPKADDIPTPFVLQYEYPFATSGAALEAVKGWNEVTFPEYVTRLDEWKAEYEAVLAKAQTTAGAADGDRHAVLGPYWHPTEMKYCIGWYDKDGYSVDQYPEYEVPAPPEFDVVPYDKAISAYCYMKSDGLSQTDWAYLKLVLCWFAPIKSNRGGAIEAQGNEKKLAKIRDKGYVTVTDALTDLAFTPDGFKHFKGLVEKLADFRAANIAVAAKKGTITGAEAGKLKTANDKIKTAFLKQLDALNAGAEGEDLDWSNHGPAFLKADFDEFEVDKESDLSNPPYRRVLESVTGPNPLLDSYFYDPKTGAEAKPYHKVEVLCSYLGIEVKSP